MDDFFQMSSKLTTALDSATAVTLNLKGGKTVHMLAIRLDETHFPGGREFIVTGFDPAKPSVFLTFHDSQIESVS
jgi:hypothetical protein